jgi:eukaryotic-like serine/threonine-protein kinase
MSEPSWAVIREILEEALEKPPSERIPFVERNCAGDPDLLQEVCRYLEYQESAEGGFELDNWIEKSLEIEEPPNDPERIGIYRILHRLGEGGMGVVYLAERDDGEFGQRVALKAVRPGVAQSSRIVEMFRRERQILAQLQHPNIAHLLDGGTYRGQIYYVMEYVEGQPVTTYCNEHNLFIRQRLELFCRICDPVSYAHRQLVIHRDLKPGNILIKPDGTPKLLDFGLAKIFREESAGEPANQATMPLLTPAYASPEQVRGEHLSTATDVYSLGVLLYELLTGTNPQSDDDASPYEVCRTILQQEPAKPSHTAGVQRQRELAGDLDEIVLMALRKEPGKRYASVEDLRRDIERWLAGFPVLASRGSTLYRVQKYVRRHRWGVATCFLGAILGISAATTIWWQGRQAEMRFNDVRELAHSVIFELHDAVRDIPQSTAARKLIVERGLQYLRKLESSGATRRDLKLEMAAAYQKIGEIQSDNSRASMADTTAALESFGQARRLLQELLGSYPNDSEVMQMLAGVYLQMADVYEQRGEEQHREDLARKGAELHLRIAALHRDRARFKAISLSTSAGNLSKRGNWKEAQRIWEQAINAYEQALTQEQQAPDLLQWLASAHTGLAQTYSELGQFESAKKHYEQALAIRSAALNAEPHNTRLAMLVSYVLIDLAWVEHGLGLHQDGESHAQRALEIQERLADADPSNSMARLEVGKTLVTIALTQKKEGRLVAATRSLERAKRMFASEFLRDPRNQSTLFYLAWSSAELGDVFVRQAKGHAGNGSLARRDWQLASNSYHESMQYLSVLKLEGKLDGMLDDRRIRASVSQRLIECKQNLK